MRIKYQSSLDDLVDVHTRLLSRLKVIRLSRWQAAFLTGALCGILAFIIIPERATVRLVSAGLSAIGGVVIHTIIFPFFHHRITRFFLRKIFLEQNGSDERYQVEMELLSEGVCTKQLGTQIVFEWPTIESIEQVNESIEIFAKPGGLAVIPERAFATYEEMIRFLEEAKRYQSEARAFR